MQTKKNGCTTEAVFSLTLGQSGSRASSQTNVYLDAFGYRDNQAFDTMSVDSTDSIETSISACSPDNVSRWGPSVLFMSVMGLSAQTIMTHRLHHRKAQVKLAESEKFKGSMLCKLCGNRGLSGNL